MRQWWCLLCTKPTCLFGFYSGSSLKQQSTDDYCKPTSLFSYSIILSCVLSRGATNASFIVFGWPTGDRTHNLSHLRQTHLTITQLRWFCSDYDAVTILLKVIKFKNLYGIHITYYHFRLNLGEFEEFTFYFWTLLISTLLNVYKNKKNKFM